VLCPDRPPLDGSKNAVREKTAEMGRGETHIHTEWFAFIPMATDIDCNYFSLCLRPCWDGGLMSRRATTPVASPGPAALFGQQDFPAWGDFTRMKKSDYGQMA